MVHDYRLHTDRESESVKLDTPKINNFMLESDLENQNVSIFVKYKFLIFFSKINTLNKTTRFTF